MNHYPNWLNDEMLIVEPKSKNFDGDIKVVELGPCSKRQLLASNIMISPLK